MATPLQGTESAANAISRVRFTHDAIIDFILANPAAHQNDLAKEFGFTVPWISRVMCSDAFQARLAERKTELIDPSIIATIEERMRGVTQQSLEILAEKLEATKSADLALNVLNVATKALGYGARVAPQVQNTNNFVVVVPPKSQSVEQWAADHGPGARVINGEKA